MKKIKLDNAFENWTNKEYARAKRIIIKTNKKREKIINRKAYGVIFLVMLILMIGVISAEEVLSTSKTFNPFGNDKIVIADSDSYQAYPDIRISDIAFYVDTNKIADYKLVNVDCGITSCNMDYNVTVYQETTLFDNQLSVTDLKTGRDTSLSSYQYLIKDGTEQYNVNNYSNTCIRSASNTNTCASIVTGTHKETRDKYIPYDFDKVRIGTYQVRLTGVIPAGASYDVKPYAQTRRFDEHAVWTSALNTNLEAYYKLDETTGTNVINSVGKAATKQGTPNQAQAGIIGTAYNGWSNTNYIDTNGAIIGNGTWTINAWLYPTALTTNHNFVGQTTASHWGTVLSHGAGDKICLEADGVGEYCGGTTVSINKWVMATIVYDGANYKVYYNGSSDSGAIGAGATNGNHYIGMDNGPDRYFVGTIDEVGYWSRALTPTEIAQLYNAGAGITYVATSAIGVTQSYPPNVYNTTSTTVAIGCNFTTTLQNISSAILNVYNSSNNLDYTNTITTTGYNDSYNATWTTTALSYDNYNWSCGFFGSKSTNASSGNSSINIGPIINPTIFNSTTYETLIENFVVPINSTGAISSPIFSYSGTNYTAALNQIAGFNYTLSYSLPIAAPYGNKSFYWDFIANGKHYSTAWQNQTVNSINFNLCNASNNVPYINLTFADEVNGTIESGAINSLTGTYGFGSSTKSITFSNLSYNSNYTFCFSPRFMTIQTSLTISYSAPGYQQRQIILNNALTNSTTNKVLLLLSSTAGQYVLFQVTNAAYVVIPGATINASTVGGLIASAVTDGAGTATFWLNPNTQTTIEVSKVGYANNIQTLFPTQTSYSILLGGSSTPVNITTNTTQYFSTYFQPINNADLNNGTTYNFIFNVNSTVQSFDSITFNITNNAGTQVGYGTSGSSQNGQVVLAINTGSSNSFSGTGCFLNSGTTQCFTNSWTIINTDGGGYSIFKGFNDFSTYMNTTGIFGLKKGFSLNLIIFFIIFLITGVMAYQFGLYSPIAVSGMIFVLTFIFDSVLGLVANPIRAVAHFPTVITGVVLVGLIIKEATGY